MPKGDHVISASVCMFVVSALRFQFDYFASIAVFRVNPSALLQRNFTQLEFSNCTKWKSWKTLWSKLICNVQRNTIKFGLVNIVIFSLASIISV